jgi:CsoR family transcriptional regulator, copper-sensing transcriptional repressor
MFKPKSVKEQQLHRLKIARGHLSKVIDMLEDDAYCIDVLHQLQAVNKGLQETGNLIMENHLKTCAADAIKKGNGEKAIKEVMEVFKKIK